MRRDLWIIEHRTPDRQQNPTALIIKRHRLDFIERLVTSIASSNNADDHAAHNEVHWASDTSWASSNSTNYHTAQTRVHWVSADVDNESQQHRLSYGTQWNLLGLWCVDSEFQKRFPTALAIIRHGVEFIEPLKTLSKAFFEIMKPDRHSNSNECHTAQNGVH